MTYAIGNVLDVLPTLDADRFQCCVTSPPYWGLRDYGTGRWDGGDPECDHRRDVQPRNSRPKGAFHGGTDDADYAREPQYKGTCGKCGATRIDEQLGLEPTPDAYVANMVRVFREVRRVLRPDGVLWLNLGDSYAGSSTMGRNDADRDIGGRGGNKFGSGNPGRQDDHERDSGCKPKDLVGIPWSVAFALRADGWYLRSEVIWSKPSPMPESVTDRPTKAHEQVFLLSKSARYFYDADAIREEMVDVASARRAAKGKASGDYQDASGRNDAGEHRSGGFVADIDAGRNARSVWTIASQPFAGAHFATMPPKLAERCILAGSRIGDEVLDPFLGSGTVGMVAESLGRRWFGVELNAAYEPLIKQRTAQVGLFGRTGS